MFNISKTVRNQQINTPTSFFIRHTKQQCYENLAFLVGKYIGKTRSDLARRAAYLCTTCAFAWSLVAMLLVYTYEYPISDFYTEREDVKDQIYQAWPMLIVFVLTDTMQGVQNGVINGLGLVSKAKFITLFDY